MPKIWQSVGLGLLALVAVLLAVVAFRPSSPAVTPEMVAEANAANEQRTKERQAKAEAVAAIPVVAFLGDSYTVGTGADDPANRWTTVLAKDQGWTEKNFGYGGTNYGTRGALDGGSTYVERVPKVIEARPDIVIVSGGGNDLGADQSEGVADTFQALREGLPDAKIIALSPFWKAEALPSDLKNVAAQIKSSVKSVGGEYLDIDNPLEGKPELLDEDGVHPNDAGYALIAKAVKSQL